MHHVKSYSVYPPLAVQTKAEMNDVMNGGSGRDLEDLILKGDHLVDSTLERVSLVYAGMKGPSVPYEIEWEEYEPY